MPGAYLAMALDRTPVSKQRPQHGRGGNTYTPQATRDAEDFWKTAVRLCFRGIKPDAKSTFSLAATFYMPTQRRQDVDNLLKLTMDALNHVVYADDNQVEEIHARIVKGDSHPRTELVVRILSKES